LNDFIFAKIKKNEHITVSIIYEYARECLDFDSSFTTLYRILKSIGYSFKKVNRRKILIERQDIINWRIRFCLKYLQLLRNPDMKFIFLDETWVYQNGSQVRQWILESNPKGVPTKFKGEGKRYTIINAGSEEGFLPNCDLILDTKINDRDYHKTMNGKLFTKWVKEHLIPALRLLNTKCVIVLDNAPYHSVKIEKPPTASSKKANMQKWLRDQNTDFEASFTKKQLWELIKPSLFGKNFVKYEIDELLKAEGHEVLRLPPYNCQYNAIELAWADCKNYYNKHIPSQLDSSDRVIKVWREALQQCSKEKWRNFIKHSEQEIKNDWQKYMGVKNIDDVPPFIINLNSDSSDSEFDSDNLDEATNMQEQELDNLNEPSTSGLHSDCSECEDIVLMIVDTTDSE
jgi:transposase